MRSVIPRSTALIFYLVFLLARVSAGPLTESEIATFTARAESKGLSSEQLARFEIFMRDDDGGEFFMVNLVGFTEGPEVIPRLAQRSMRASWCRAISTLCSQNSCPGWIPSIFCPYSVGLY